MQIIFDPSPAVLDGDLTLNCYRMKTFAVNSEINLLSLLKLTKVQWKILEHFGMQLKDL